MAVFKCKMCGGELQIGAGATVAECEYCGTQQTLPRLSDDRKANLYDRANHFRRNNDFDKAMGIYEQLLNEDGTDAEAYWSLVLCRYGIEYVADPKTRKQIPTVNRAQFTSVFDDDNYKSALQYADLAQRQLYEAEARAINEIQKGILTISQKEEPFDVFICYKETDSNGRRTPDSVLATDLYHQLVREGFKVFFSRITLEDKLGAAYEPYIFAALNSAKVMVVLGTRPEYFQAVWVKNEWSRYLALIRQGQQKILIPAYRDMDPYDLPEEFSHLQAQDMSKLGFMQDLLYGIKKQVRATVPLSAVVKETVLAGGGANTEALLKRVFMFLEDGDWNAADEYCEKVLDADPECARAYLGKLMAELNVSQQSQLKDQEKPFDDRNPYKKAIRFGDDSLKTTLIGYLDHINTRNEQIRLAEAYRVATAGMYNARTEQAYMQAARMLAQLGEYKDAPQLTQKCREKAAKIRQEREHQAEVDRIAAARWAEEERLENERKAKKRKKSWAIVFGCMVVVIAFLIILLKVILPASNYNKAVALMEDGQYYEAFMIFKKLGDYKPSQEKAEACKEKLYEEAVALMETGNKVEAAFRFYALGDYRYAETQSARLWEQIADRKTIAAGGYHAVGVKVNGTAIAVGTDNDGLLSNRYVGQCNVSGWTNIVAVAAGSSHTVGLKADGTVVATGDNENGQCNVSGWTNIVAIAAGGDHTVGLKADGTVVAVGTNAEGQCKVNAWKDVVAIAAGITHTVALKANGTVVATGGNDDAQCNVSDWTNIVAIAAGCRHTVGLKADGTVVSVGNNDGGQRNVGDWTNIVAIAAGYWHTVGLKANGTVVAVGSKNYAYGQCAVAGWKNITAIAAGFSQTVGLKTDGTVVTVGYNFYGECDADKWSGIKMPE